MRLEFSGYVTHLPVNQAHNGSLHPHPYGEASVHVLVVEEGLETGQQEHQGGVEVAFPQRSVLVPHEIQKKAVEEDRNSIRMFVFFV